jgi:acetyl/propionyl-CoA carboxylase alpha subunit
MTFEIELNGRGRTVSIERAGHGQYRVTVDGVAAIVDAQRSGEFGVSLLFPDRSHEGVSVQLAPGRTPGEMLAYLGGRNITVSVNGRRTGRGAADNAGAARGEQKVLAPMPGRVVRVLVNVGEVVEARQPVVVVEAMKMENELRSPKAGTVKDVAVTPGTSVEAGRVLVVIE